MRNSLATAMINGYEADLRGGVELARVSRHAVNRIKALQAKGDWVSKEAAQSISHWLESKIPC